MRWGHALRLRDHESGGGRSPALAASGLESEDRNGGCRKAHGTHRCSSMEPSAPPRPLTPAPAPAQHTEGTLTASLTPR
jgi:hypothetical protein